MSPEATLLLAMAIVGVTAVVAVLACVGLARFVITKLTDELRSTRERYAQEFESLTDRVMARSVTEAAQATAIRAGPENGELREVVEQAIDARLDQRFEPGP